MIERYTRPEMGAIWSQDHKIQQWLAVEELPVTASGKVARHRLRELWDQQG